MRAVWLALLFVIPGAVAQSGNPDDYNWSNDFGCGGGVAFEDVDSKSASYSSCSFSGGPGGGSVEVMEMFVSVTSTARLHMEGFSARGSQSGGSATAFEMELDILQVVEFVDDGDGKFVPENDEIVRQHSLNGGWSNIRTSQPSEGGIRFEADHDIGSGTFTLAGVARGANFNAGGIQVRPLDTKIDFIFTDYTYEHPESQLALVLFVSSEGFSAKGSSFNTGGAVVQSRESGVVGSQGATSLYFTWAKTADVDGTSRAVGSHVDIVDSDSMDASQGGSQATVSEIHAGVTLAYARGQDIVHDPRLGVQFNVQKDSPGLPMAAVLLALAALAAVKRR